jgi:hypothetical protein
MTSYTKNGRSKTQFAQTGEWLFTSGTQELIRPGVDHMQLLIDWILAISIAHRILPYLILPVEILVSTLPMLNVQIVVKDACSALVCLVLISGGIRIRRGAYATITYICGLCNE